MRLYFDTAYIAKCYLNEPDGKAVRGLAMRATGLYSSMLAVAEMACVFQRQIREGRLSRDQASEWHGTFLDDIRQGTWVLLPVSARLLYLVDSLALTLPAESYLRAGDAIHIVTARDSGFSEIWSNDQHLLAAAERFGLNGRSVGK